MVTERRMGRPPKQHSDAVYVVRWTNLISEEQKDYLFTRAAMAGVTPSEYLRSLIDRDRDENQ